MARKMGAPVGTIPRRPHDPSHNAERRRIDAAAALLSGSRPLPLDIMLEAMWSHYQDAEISKAEGNAERAAAKLAAAAEQAERCAPYVHPRLAAATVTHRDALDDLSVDQLRALLAVTERAAGAIGGTIEGEAEPAVGGDEAG